MRTKGGARFRTGAPGSFITGSGSRIATRSIRESPEKKKAKDLQALRLQARKKKRLSLKTSLETAHETQIVINPSKVSPKFTVKCSCGFSQVLTSRNEAIELRNKHLGRKTPPKMPRQELSRKKRR